MNKYEKALQVTTYWNHGELIVENYKKSLDDMPIMLRSDQFEFRKECGKGRPHIRAVSDEERAILETIYIGKCMTLEQLVIYLRLKGFGGSVSRTRSVLDNLIYHKLIQRICISWTGDDEICKRKYYAVGEYTPCKKIGLPNLTAKKMFILRKECGSDWPRFCMAMHVLNQIVLHQILFNNSVERFLIGEVKIKHDYQVALPLVLFSPQMYSAFIIVTYMDASRIDVITDKWRRYVKETGKRLRLIFITRDETQQLIVRRRVEELKLDDLEVAYSNYTDWFRNTENQIYVKTNLLALEA